jgi:hypothetical protein
MSASSACGAQTSAPSPERIQRLGCVCCRLTVSTFMATKVGIKQSGAQINQPWDYLTEPIVTCWHEEFVMFGIKAFVSCFMGVKLGLSH